VEKVAQSKQLGTAHPSEILVLFENWLEELESPTTDNVSGLDLQLIFKTLCLYSVEAVGYGSSVSKIFKQFLHERTPSF
jgi:hypothetical protein